MTAQVYATFYTNIFHQYFNKTRLKAIQGFHKQNSMTFKTQTLFQPWKWNKKIKTFKDFLSLADCKVTK